MNLQQAFIKVKSIKQENFLLDGTYNKNRYWGWKAFNEDCNAIQTVLTNHLADFGPSQEAPTFCETITANNLSRDILQQMPPRLDEDAISEGAAYMSDEDFPEAYGMIFYSMEDSGRKDAEDIEDAALKIAVHQITPSDLNQLAELANLNADEAEAVIDEQNIIDNTEFFIDQSLSHSVEQYGSIEAADVYLDWIEKKPYLALPTGFHASYNIWRINQLEQMTRLFAKIRKAEYLQRLQNLKNTIRKAGDKDSIIKIIPSDVVRAIDHCRKDVFREMIARRLVREIHTIFSSRQPAQVGAILSDIKITALLKEQEETSRSAPEQEEPTHSR